LEPAGGEAMNEFAKAIQWIFSASNWKQVNLGTGIAGALAYHLELSAISLAIAAAIAIPAGLVVGHLRRGKVLASSVATIGRAVPSFALLVLAFIVISNKWPSLGFSMLPTIIALTVLAIPPILVNTYVGIEGVDVATVDAARGMGMSGTQLLTKLEIPLGAALIMAGVRTSAVTVVASATLAGFAGGGGLGVFLYEGFAQQGQEQVLLGGAILVALLAIITEALFGALERAVAPRTESGRKGHRLLG
jgi:osmoprotectant transport system permease protein